MKLKYEIKFERKIDFQQAIIFDLKSYFKFKLMF